MLVQKSPREIDSQYQRDKHLETLGQQVRDVYGKYLRKDDPLLPTPAVPATEDMEESKETGPLMALINIINRLVTHLLEWGSHAKE